MSMRFKGDDACGTWKLVSPALMLTRHKQISLRPLNVVRWKGNSITARLLCNWTCDPEVKKLPILLVSHLAEVSRVGGRAMQSVRGCCLNHPCLVLYEKKKSNQLNKNQYLLLLVCLNSLFCVVDTRHPGWIDKGGRGSFPPDRCDGFEIAPCCIYKGKVPVCLFL